MNTILDSETEDPAPFLLFTKTRYPPSCASLSPRPKKKKKEFIIKGLRPKLLKKMEFLLKTTKTHSQVYFYYFFGAAASQEPPSHDPEGGTGWRGYRHGGPSSQMQPSLQMVMLEPAGTRRSLLPFLTLRSVHDVMFLS